MMKPIETKNPYIWMIGPLNKEKANQSERKRNKNKEKKNGRKPIFNGIHQVEDEFTTTVLSFFI